MSGRRRNGREEEHGKVSLDKQEEGKKGKREEVLLTDDLARPSLDDNVSSLPEGGTLGRERYKGGRERERGKHEADELQST